MVTPVLNNSPAWDALLTAAHVWQLRSAALQSPAVRDRWLNRLSADELARYERFPTAKARESYLATRVLCRTTLSSYTGVDPSQWQFAEDAYGKPAIAEPNGFKSLRFNLTHTDDLTICAVTRAGEVGVDAEETSWPVDVSLVARHFFSRRAQKRLASLAPHECLARFYEQWVLKEAYAKAIGKGLAYTSERLTVEQGRSGEPLAIGTCRFSLHRPSAKHVAAAAFLPVRGADPASIHWFVRNMSAA
jgi:4'-phosphopantetheinyl transferase